MKRTAAQRTITGERFILISIPATSVSDTEGFGGSGARSAAAARVLSTADGDGLALLLVLPVEDAPPPAQRLSPLLDILARIFFLGVGRCAKGRNRER